MLNDPRGVRPAVLVMVGLVVGGVGWLVLRLLSAQGSSVPSVGWFSSVVILLASGVVLAEGYQVKKLQSGTAGPRQVSMVRAARTVVLAQAAALTGAAVVGWYAAQVLFYLPDLDVTSVREKMWPILATMAAGLGLAIAGLVAQRWCRIDDSDRKPPTIETAAGAV